MQTYCEQNATRALPEGGLPIDENNQADLDHINLIINKWENAISDVGVLRGFPQIKSVTIDIQCFQALVNEPDCVGVRFFPGFDENNNFTLIMRGVYTSERILRVGDVILCCPRTP